MKKQDSGQPDPGSPGAPPLPAKHEGAGNKAVREGTASPQEGSAEGSAPSHGSEYTGPAGDPDKRI